MTKVRREWVSAALELLFPLLLIPAWCWLVLTRIFGPASSPRRSARLRDLRETLSLLPWCLMATFSMGLGSLAMLLSAGRKSLALLKNCVLAGKGSTNS